MKGSNCQIYIDHCRCLQEALVPVVDQNRQVNQNIEDAIHHALFQDCMPLKHQRRKTKGDLAYYFGVADIYGDIVL